MTRLSTHLDAVDAFVRGLQFAGAPLVTECRRQLDLVDAEDISRASFHAPAAFLVLPRARLEPRADGGRDCEIWVVIAIAGKAVPGKSVDADTIDRAIALAAALDDATFGEIACSPPGEIECRPILSSGIETKGLALAAVSFRQTLYRIVEPPVATQEALVATGTGTRPGGVPAPQDMNDGALSEDELQVVGQWGTP